MDSEAAAAFIERVTPNWIASAYHGTPYPYNEAFKQHRNNEVDLIHKCYARNNECQKVAKRRKHARDRILYNFGNSAWKNTNAAFVEYEMLDWCLKSSVRDLQQLVLDLQVETQSRRAVYLEVLRKAWLRRNPTRDEQDVLRNYHPEVEYKTELVALFDHHNESVSQGLDVRDMPATHFFKIIGDEPRGVIGAVIHWIIVAVWKLIQTVLFGH